MAKQVSAADVRGGRERPPYRAAYTVVFSETRLRAQTAPGRSFYALGVSTALPPM